MGHGKSHVLTKFQLNPGECLGRWVWHELLAWSVLSAAQGSCQPHRLGGWVGMEHAQCCSGILPALLGCAPCGPAELLS